MRQKSNTPLSFFVKNANDSRIYEWEPVLFSYRNNGFNVYHREHHFSKQGNGGYAEKMVGMLLAVINGKQVIFLPEKARVGMHPDLWFDGMTWDVKYINHANIETIRKYIKNGRKADNVIFFWDATISRVLDIKTAVARSHTHIIRNGNKMPGIWYFNEIGILKNIIK